ncbi:uncharacterized protein Z520_05471 [Fonsecaea multimorphosa CBS 102226]|uniref:Uncharacterized protein n=1 Tax=Fonsecaea multimorphosa CBS 102226 TaxID=1442371 RepID=A0A0D2HAT8_9EURO|nr:uncharacterized protein Z520_05471 [Fonsecaea multimorphosa CBS 102226]KIX99010.1 hypothetical protein Z520_05471 [Fonsecaea multimorphosa CBS 102226]OAL25279.1 hypothetical protein AYO22_05156 [Fonsecaea multimorphosa]
MYSSLLLPWSTSPSDREKTYRAAGLVKTKGTLFLLPPPTSTLRDSFKAPPRPKTRMSSGAVALCKHFERGGASSEHGRPHSFWTLPAGSNENKTEIARGILENMLVHAVWRNVMLLHHGVAVYEIRNAWGYGMRWTLDIEEKKEDKQADVGIPIDIQTTTASLDTPNQGEDEDDFHKDWIITRTTFRGFLEPIAGMDHELPGQGVSAGESSQPLEQTSDRLIA